MYNGKAAKEVICAHPDDPDLVQAELRLPHPYGEGWYEQFHQLPESRFGYIRTGNSVSRGSCHFWPPLEGALIPKKRHGLPWIPITGKPYEFERGKGQWRETLKLNFFFRLLHPVTDRYQEAYNCFQLLLDMNPNDGNWKDRYNRTINQWKLRRDAEYVKLRRWDRWTIAEICALYTAVNKFCRISGVSQFGIHEAGLTQSALRIIVDKVNAVGKKMRQINAIRSMIRNANANRYKLLFDLATEAAAMRARKEKGETFVEVKPLHAILLSQFPNDSDSSVPARVAAKSNRKRKADVQDEEEEGSISGGTEVVQPKPKKVRSHP